MNKRYVYFFALTMLMSLVLYGMAFANSTNEKKGEITYVESTDVKFDGRIGFHQETMGTMDDLIDKYKRGEKGVKIFATGKIIDKSGNSLEDFDEVPASIITIDGLNYYQFDKGNWRFRSSTNSFENYRKVFKREN